MYFGTKLLKSIFIIKYQNSTLSITQPFWKNDYKNTI
jgi:hypothetical protein